MDENVMPSVVLSHLCMCSRSSQSVHVLSVVAENIQKTLARNVHV